MNNRVPKHFILMTVLSFVAASCASQVQSDAESCTRWANTKTQGFESDFCANVWEMTLQSEFELIDIGKTDDEWKNVKARYDCGEVSKELVDLANSPDMPRGLFKSDEVKDLSAQYKIVSGPAALDSQFVCKATD